MNTRSLIGRASGSDRFAPLRPLTLFTSVASDPRTQLKHNAICHCFRCMPPVRAAVGPAPLAYVQRGTSIPQHVFRDHFGRFAAQYDRNLFDTQTGFMRGKSSSGKWRPDFNPMSVSIHDKGHFTGGNAWQYSFFVPQDVSRLTTLYGGDEKLAKKLDDLFSQPSVNDDAKSPDVTGRIGQYAHGNEPSHQVAYLYAYAGKPYKTQERVRDIMSTLYADTRRGLCGDEDCGQMSAWYVLSAVRFHPVNPADGTHVVGNPLFDRAAITLPNGRAFVIRANGVSDTNRYIQSATPNGKPYGSSFIAHRDVMRGGELVFVMGKKPAAWGTRPARGPCQQSGRPITRSFGWGAPRC